MMTELVSGFMSGPLISMSGMLALCRNFMSVSLMLDSMMTSLLIRRTRRKLIPLCRKLVLFRHLMNMVVHFSCLSLCLTRFTKELVKGPAVSPTRTFMAQSRVAVNVWLTRPGRQCSLLTVLVT